MANVTQTFNDLYAKVKVIHFYINRSLMYDFLQAIKSNFCSKTHRLATIHIRH